MFFIFKVLLTQLTVYVQIMCKGSIYNNKSPNSYTQVGSYKKLYNLFHNIQLCKIHSQHLNTCVCV